MGFLLPVGVTRAAARAGCTGCTGWAGWAGCRGSDLAKVVWKRDSGVVRGLCGLRGRLGRVGRGLGVVVDGGGGGGVGLALALVPS